MYRRFFFVFGIFRLTVINFFRLHYLEALFRMGSRNQSIDQLLLIFFCNSLETKDFRSGKIDT